MEHKFLNIIGICAVMASLIMVGVFTKGRQMNTGIKLQDMDTTVVPGDDFYDFATRGWRIANPIPADYSRYGMFDVLVNTNLERVRDIAEHDDGKIGLLYKIAMDEKKLNADGTKPVQKYIDEIDAIKSRENSMRLPMDFLAMAWDWMKKTVNIIYITLVKTASAWRAIIILTMTKNLFRCVKNISNTLKKLWRISIYRLMQKNYLIWKNAWQNLSIKKKSCATRLQIITKCQSRNYAQNFLGLIGISILPHAVLNRPM